MFGGLDIGCYFLSKYINQTGHNINMKKNPLLTIWQCDSPPALSFLKVVFLPALAWHRRRMSICGTLMFPTGSSRYWHCIYNERRALDKHMADNTNWWCEECWCFAAVVYFLCWPDAAPLLNCSYSDETAWHLCRLVTDMQFSDVQILPLEQPDW